MTRRNLTLVAGLAILAVLLTALLLPTPAHAQTTQVVEYYHTDALGSVRAVTNQQGQVIRRHDILPFGEELQPTVPPPDKPLFTGKERDAETGLDYFGARYQRAGVGRFTTVDPAMTLDKNLADPQRWNRYAYARTNPLRWVDPDGRTPGPVSLEGFRPFMKWAEEQRESIRLALGNGTFASVTDVFLAGVLPKNSREFAEAGAAAILGVAAPLQVGGLPSSKALGAAMEAAGISRPLSSAAHHIVPGGARAAEPGQAALARFGIGINEAVNGVFLPANRAVPNVTGAAVHSTLHTGAYIDAVNLALAQATSRQEATQVLDVFRQTLLNGAWK